MKRLTKKEEIIMNWFWDKGPLYVKELQELYPDPQPHFNTLSTQVRTLESNGYLKHNSFSGSFQYYPAFSREKYSEMSLDNLIWSSARYQPTSVSPSIRSVSTRLPWCTRWRNWE